MSTIIEQSIRLTLYVGPKDVAEFFQTDEEDRIISFKADINDRIKFIKEQALILFKMQKNINTLKISSIIDTLRKVKCDINAEDIGANIDNIIKKIEMHGKYSKLELNIKKLISPHLYEHALALTFYADMQ
jgi:hypothetical protein